MKKTFKLISCLMLGVMTLLSFSASGATLMPELQKMKRITSPEFSSLFVGSNIKVEIRQGAYPGYIEIEDAGENYSVYTEWKDNTLNIYPNMPEKEEIKVRITTNSLNTISLSSATLDASSLTFINSFTLNLYGQSKTKIGNLWASDININVYGEGVVNINGVISQNLRLDAWRNSKIDIKGIRVENVNATSRYSSLISLSGKCRTKSLSFVNEGKISSENLYEDPDMQQVIPDSVDSSKLLYFHPSQDKGTKKSGSPKKKEKSTPRKGSPVTQP
ncbi:MAG: DUF2807 domain-containing protein [Muribaculaceae bacterium]|nr:DUF2807 domain-containing protein [Muribaculaceae bacterium]